MCRNSRVVLVKMVFPKENGLAVWMFKLTILFCCCLLSCNKVKPEELHLFQNLNGKYGFADKAGKIVIPAFFDGATEFSEGLAAVRIKGLCGYIDSEADIVIEPRFEYAKTFTNGVAWVMLDNKWGLIDKKGKYSAFPYDDVEELRPDGFARVNLNSKVGVIDSSGKVVVKPIYESVFYDPNFLNKDLFFVKVEGKFGLINTAGVYVIEPTFDRVDYSAANNFLMPYLRVAIIREIPWGDPREGPYRWGLVDKAGKVVLPPIVEEMKPIARDLAEVRVKGKWGLINTKTLEFTTEPQCMNIEKTPQGEIRCEKEFNVWSLVDEHGRLL